jgi:serine/threonine-protein kinase
MLVLAEDEEDPLIGTTVDGRYLVQSMLGQGGMGAVYKAHQKTMNRSIALKVLKRELSGDPQIVKRFLREVQATSVLRHPNTIAVYDFGQTPENLLYIAMEYLEGMPLADKIKNEGPRSVDRALQIVQDSLSALAEAHDKGIVHRDLKPDNLFLANMGGKEVLKVLDFGIAKLDTGDNQTQLTRSGLTVGTPPYMSPEQAEGRAEITPASDIYSMGCILFECLTGRPPFIGESPVKILMDHCTAAPPPLKEANPGVNVPPAVEALVMQMLAKDHRERPGPADVLADHIGALRKSGGQATGLAPAPDLGYDSTGAWDSAEVSAAVAAQANPYDATGAFTTSDAAAASMRPNTELAGEAVSTEAAMASLKGGGGGKWLALVAVLVLAGGGGAFFMMNQKKPNPSRAAATAVATPVKPKEDKPKPEKKKEFWLQSQPDAEIYEDKEKIGKTPLKMDTPEGIRRLVLKAKGFKDMEISIGPFSTDTMKVNLIAAPRIVRQAPRPSRPRRPARKKKKKASEEDILVDDLK